MNIFTRIITPGKACFENIFFRFQIKLLDSTRNFDEKKRPEKRLLKFKLITGFLLDLKIFPVSLTTKAIGENV